MLCLLDYPSHPPLLGVAISRKRVSWCVRSTRLDDYGHLTSHCRRHRPAPSAYRLTGNTYCTLLGEGWHGLRSQPTSLTINLTLHLEVPVFLSALMYTTRHQTPKSAFDDCENTSLKPEDCRSGQKLPVFYSTCIDSEPERAGVRAGASSHRVLQIDKQCSSPTAVVKALVVRLSVGGAARLVPELYASRND